MEQRVRERVCATIREAGAADGHYPTPTCSHNPIGTYINPSMHDCNAQQSAHSAAGNISSFHMVAAGEERKGTWGPK